LDEEFYEQTDDGDMSSPLSPVIANFLMDHFEEPTLKGQATSPSAGSAAWTTRPQGSSNLLEFLDHLKSIHENIQFTMETKRDGHLPFLDVATYRKPDGSPCHKVYRKTTQTNLYIISYTRHHPSNKQAVLSTLVHTARSLCDQNSLHSELDYLRTTFRESGYSDRQMRWALNPSERVAPPLEEPASVAFLPYVSTTFNRIGRLLSRHNIMSVGLPPKKIPSFLRPVNYYLELNTPGV
jgi:hypothetical protein